MPLNKLNRMNRILMSVGVGFIGSYVVRPLVKPIKLLKNK